MKPTVFLNGESDLFKVTFSSLALQLCYLFSFSFAYLSVTLCGINNHEHFGRSHNFRPSYMRLKASLLRDRLGAQCILAMTATATTKTLYSVMHALDIPSSNLIQAVKPRDNLQLSVSLSENR